MRILITEEFFKSLMNNMLPLNGFKVKLVKYRNGFNPSNISQSTTFVSYSLSSDCLALKSGRSYDLLFELSDDPHKIYNNVRYYDGVLFYYKNISETNNKIAFLLDYESNYLVKRLNHIKLNLATIVYNSNSHITKSIPSIFPIGEKLDNNYLFSEDYSMDKIKSNTLIASYYKLIFNNNSDYKTVNDYLVNLLKDKSGLTNVKYNLIISE